jgi:hypothetical protein
VLEKCLKMLAYYLLLLYLPIIHDTMAHELDLDIGDITPSFSVVLLSWANWLL